MKFALIVHLCHLKQRVPQGLTASPGCTTSLQQVSLLLRGLAQLALDPSAPQGVAVVEPRLVIRSAQGKIAEARVWEVPFGTEEFLLDPAAALESTRQALELAHTWGAELIGLGGLCGYIGEGGQELATHSPLPLTQGNSLAVFSVQQNLRLACAEADLVLADAEVTIVGTSGAVSAATARLVAPLVRRLTLATLDTLGRTGELANELQVELTGDIQAAVSSADIVLVSAAEADGFDPADMRSGSILIDIDVAFDLLPPIHRRDILLVSGDVCEVPAATPRDSLFLSLGRGMLTADLAEAMVLAMADRAESFSLGSHVDPQRAELIGQLALRQGFQFRTLCCGSEAISDENLVAFRKARAGQTRAGQARAGQGSAAAGNTADMPSAEALAPRAAARFSRYLNPVLSAISGNSGFTKVFVRGEGNYLFDAEGGRYLDFVSGFGSVNLGHNHPRVVAAVAEALRTKAPGFAQSAINPFAAALAESLIDLSPPGLEMVFFCNSGTESVEAALKLARAATGRGGLLCCQGSFHGKTLGALSVTANPTYRRPFEPLLPNTTVVPYGDLVALEEALATGQFAALILEPIQAEVGIITPPPGYLREAQRLCRENDTLLIADEVQTGLGRTGLMFACERDELEPDIMTLAKSLGGGLMPIGAMLCRRSLWREAYGTVHRFALHTSTFGGGSLACAAALETLRVLKEEPLIRNAAEQGERLRAGLTLLWREMFDSIGEVRGEGLLLGLDLLPIRPSIAAHWKRNDATGLGEYLVPGLDKLLENIQSVYLMQTLLSSFGIYTQAARSNPNVLRVQPPLGIEDQEVDHFLLAVGTLCRELRKMSAEMHGMITKTAIGMHDSK